MSVIEAANLTKTYRTFQRRSGVWGAVKDLFYREYEPLTAVDAISFAINDGELVGYIGPNGAGKSTSIKMLTGILRPSGGTARVLGYDPYSERKTYTHHIGVVFGQRTQLWWDIAVQESFRLLAKIYRVPEPLFKERLGQLSSILGLERLLATPVRKLSLGERMRCDLAASLLHRPRVLFLDEPTIGLDTLGKDAIRAFLKQVNENFGTTIILTTHDLREIEELCRRIIVIDHGRIIYDGALSALKAMPGIKRSLTVDFSATVSPGELIRLFDGKIPFEQQGERRASCEFDPQAIIPAEVVRTLMNALPVADLTLAEPSIEQVIMKIYRDGAQ
ncbi:MAG TPA: ATP-binding cassette domain-containing protein [Oligoflexia bacterium]|nr:ATP-binding cassette domain-containing protein [Oligoflexia bacterium]